MSKSLQSIQREAAVWLRQGISPRRLALTLALGFAIGCFPIMGVPTAMCVVLAIGLRLNLPAIQAANYAVMPLQWALVVPFARFGGWLLPSGSNQSGRMGALLHTSTLVLRLGTLAGQASLAWLVIAGPAIVLMTVTLTVLLRRVPMLAAAENAD